MQKNICKTTSTRYQTRSMTFIDQLKKDAETSRDSLTAYNAIEAPTSDDSGKTKFLTLYAQYGGEFKGIVSAIGDDYLTLQEQIGGETFNTLRFDAIAAYRVF